MDHDVMNSNRPIFKKLIVIIPALNEQLTIASVISNISKHFDHVGEVQVLVIDDGSTDRTAEIARSCGAEVIRSVRNRGVGFAFQTGIREALRRGADIMVNLDGDGQFDPQDIPKLLAPILSGQAEFVTATRFANPQEMPKMSALKLWGNKWMTRIINFLIKINFTDVSCGFRAYTRNAALNLNLFGHFTYTQETLIDLAYKDVVMTEVPIRVRGERKYGRSRVASNVWRYGLKSATIIFRTARDHSPIYFFGIPGIVILLLGTAGALFLLIHYLQTGQTFPYRSLVQVSGVLVIVGVLLFFLSMLADMLHRNRIILEKILYHSRKDSYEHDERRNQG